MSAPPPASLRPWDHVRAALIAVHVVAVVGMSLPSPEGYSARRALEDPKFARPLAVWVDALAEVGVPAALTRRVAVDGGETLERVEDGAERLFAPYARYAGVKQSWRMFSSSGPKSWRLELWLREGDVLRPIYVALDPTARWRAALWEHGRVRGAVQALGQDKFSSWWEALARSAARRAAVDFPEATALRLQRVPLRFPTPEALAVTGRVAARAPTDVVDVALAPLRGGP